MFHYVHQLVVNCVCLQLDAEQVVYSEFLEPAVAENNTVRALRVNQNSKEQKLSIKLCKAELQSGDNSL